MYEEDARWWKWKEGWICFGKKKVGLVGDCNLLVDYSPILLCNLAGASPAAAWAWEWAWATCLHSVFISVAEERIEDAWQALLETCLRTVGDIPDLHTRPQI
ncbi:hypothetical protein ACJX0J_015257, partial [Zea mays]